MKAKDIIKSLLILTLLGTLIFIKLYYTEMGDYAEIALDALIAIIILTTGQQLLGLIFLLPFQLYNKENRLSKSQDTANSE